MATILVTGASRGIGLEFVRQYAAAGERIFASCRRPDEAAALKTIAAQSDGRVSLHPLDVTDAGQIAALADALKDQPLDMLISNAGVSGDLHTGEEGDDALWLETFRTNTIAPYRLARAFKHHLERGAMRRLLCLSSGRASHVRHKAVGYAYGASKAALNNAVYGLSVEWGKTFTVVLLAPGPVKTDMNVNGKLSAEFSVGALRRIIAGLNPDDSGRYIDYEGKDVAW